MSDRNFPDLRESEISILSAAYTVYRLTCEDPISPADFLEKYHESGVVFHDLICGFTDRYRRRRLLSRQRVALLCGPANLMRVRSADTV